MINVDQYEVGRDTYVEQRVLLVQRNNGSKTLAERETTTTLRFSERVE